MGDVAEGQWPVRGFRIDYYSCSFALINGRRLSLETAEADSE